MATTEAASERPPYRYRPGQRNFRIKLACPECRAIAYTTSANLNRTGGIRCANDGSLFIEAAPNAYRPRRTGVAATA